MGTESRETSLGSTGHVQAVYAPSSWRAMEYEQANHPEAPFNPASQSVGLGGTCVPASLTISQMTPGLRICSSCVDFYLKPVSETGGKPGWLTWTCSLPAAANSLAVSFPGKTLSSCVSAGSLRTEQRPPLQAPA